MSAERRSPLCDIASISDGGHPLNLRDDGAPCPERHQPASEWCCEVVDLPVADGASTAARASVVVEGEVENVEASCRLLGKPGSTVPHLALLIATVALSR